MDKEEKKNIETFYQSAEISASIADDFVGEKQYTQAIRMLWEAYNFSGKSIYLEKIAILYGIIDGAEEEGINLLADLYINNSDMNISKKALIINALHLKLKSQIVSEDASFGTADADFINVLDEIAENIGAEVVEKNREPFYIYDKNTAYINDIKSKVTSAFERFNDKAYFAIQNEILSLVNFKKYEELLTTVIYIGLTYNADNLIVPLVEKLLELDNSNQFAIIAALTISKELKINPFKFNINLLVTVLANKYIEKKSYNQLGLLLLNMPYSLCKNAVLVALVALSKVDEHALKTLYAMAAQYMNIGNLDAAKKYIEIGKTIYPRSPLFLYLDWYKDNYFSFVQLDILNNKDKISALLLKELILEVELYEKNFNSIDGASDELKTVSMHPLEKWKFRERISILLFLGCIQDINALFDRLVTHSNRKSYFNFLIKEISSAYHELPVKMSIFTAIQYINKDFQNRAFTLFNKSIFTGKITTQVFDENDSNYKRLKKAYVDIATNLFFIDVSIDWRLLKKIIMYFEKIDEIDKYSYNDYLAAIMTVYYKLIETDSDINFVYQALKVDVKAVKILAKKYGEIFGYS